MASVLSGASTQNPFAWSEKYSVGIATIDRQHQQLLKMLEQLQEAMRGGKAKEVLGNILQQLTNYTRTHFATEETYFNRHDYPDAEVHKKQHAEFISKVQEFYSGFTSGKVTLTVQVFNFLRDWVVRHIAESDKKYGPFLREKGAI